MRLFALLVVSLIIPLVLTLPRFFKGRFNDGFLGQPGHSNLYRVSFPYNPDDVKTLWYDQRLDHFSPTDTTLWKQRYYLFDKFFVPNGPVFLMLGGEGEATANWFNNTQWVVWGQKYGALCIQLEHRYYGQSHPTPDASTSNLRWLTSEQALADAASFVSAIVAEKQLESSKWVVFGGSYSGSLAAWLRLKYPHLIYSAVASSAPLLAIVNFSAYLDVVTDSLNSVNPQCIKEIQLAVDVLETRIQKRDRLQDLNSLFLLCDPIDPNNGNDIANLYETLAGNFEGVVQYNRDNRLSGGVKFTMDELCEWMSDPTYGITPLERYASVNSILLRGGGPPGLEPSVTQCTDYKYSKFLAQMQASSWSSDTISARLWTYQTCDEFAFFQSSDSPRHPFGRHFPIEFFVKQCADIFGASFTPSFVSSSVDASNAYYGALAYTGTRVVLPNGSVDPWHALGVLRDLSTDTRAIYINGTAHCADMYPSASTDLPSLVAARREIDAQLGQWLQPSSRQEKLSLKFWKHDLL